MNPFNQIIFLIQDLDRWAYSKKIPIFLCPIVIFFYPVTLSIIVYRLARFVFLIKFKPLKYLLFPIIFFPKRFIDFLSSNEISEKANIKGGFYIGHSGCIVIGGGTVAGYNFSIRQGVTFGGGSSIGKLNHPVVGNNVVIGAGAMVIGALVIGDNVMIGANSVVTKDIESNSRAAGIPAKILNKNGVYGINVRPFWKSK